VTDMPEGDQVRELFGRELEPFAADERTTVLAALTGVLGWGFWNVLRTSGRDSDDARAAVHRTVAALVGLA
jgi:hypothetical protein